MHGWVLAETGDSWVSNKGLGSHGTTNVTNVIFASLLLVLFPYLSASWEWCGGCPRRVLYIHAVCLCHSWGTLNLRIWIFFNEQLANLTSFPEELLSLSFNVGQHPWKDKNRLCHCSQHLKNCWRSMGNCLPNWPVNKNNWEPCPNC